MSHLCLLPDRSQPGLFGFVGSNSKHRAWHVMHRDTGRSLDTGDPVWVQAQAFSDRSSGTRGFQSILASNQQSASRDTCLSGPAGVIEHRHTEPGYAKLVRNGAADDAASDDGYVP
jgi:hypothetical protein